MPDPKNGVKSAEKIPALIVFGRFRGSNLNQAAVFLKKDAEAAKKAALDAGLSSLEVQTEEHRRAAATLPEGAECSARIQMMSPLSAAPCGPCSAAPSSPGHDLLDRLALEKMLTPNPANRLHP
jgi:hypothetical protein